MLPTLILLLRQEKGKKESKMSFFKKAKTQTSNDYYDAYKAEALGIKSERKGLFSLNNIIKMEFVALTAGLLFMGNNHFFENISIKLDKNSFISKSLLPTSSNFDSEDTELMVQLEQHDAEPIEIKEESSMGILTTLSQKSGYNSEDLNLIIELIKSQVDTSIETVKEDSIIISQANF